MALLGLAFVFNSSASDWRSKLKQELKEGREWALKLDSRKVKGEETAVRLRYDRAIYARVTQRCEGQVLAVNQANGVTTVVFGRLRQGGVEAELLGGISGNSQDRGVEEGKRISGTATLLWKETDRPVPLSLGMSVYLGLDEKKMVRAFYYTGSKLLAVRQRPDGQWEELIQVSEENQRSQSLIVLFANHTDLEGDEMMSGSPPHHDRME